MSVSSATSGGVLSLTAAVAADTLLSADCLLEDMEAWEDPRPSVRCVCRSGAVLWESVRSQGLWGGWGVPCIVWLRD